MPDSFLIAPFEMAGSFGGFVFTEAGKRRMVLRSEGHDCLLKVPRLLRRRIIGKFRPGDLIRVAGTGERDETTGLLRRVVSRVLPDVAVREGSIPGTAPRPAVASPIKVCSKKNCWRNGGHALWQALQRELVSRGPDHRVELRQVGCLDRCKRAPNVDWGDHEYAHCSVADAPAMIARAAGGSPIGSDRDKWSPTTGDVVG